MHFKFLYLALLAKRRTAMGRLGMRALGVPFWARDMTDWVVAEEIHKRMSCREDKVVEDLETWAELRTAFSEWNGERDNLSSPTQQGDGSD